MTNGMKPVKRFWTEEQEDGSITAFVEYPDGTKYRFTNVTLQSRVEEDIKTAELEACSEFKFDIVRASPDQPALELRKENEKISERIKRAAPLVYQALTTRGETMPETAAADLTRANYELRIELDRLREWISDLQAGTFINCVYCGHRYGPDDEVPASMAELLKQHVEKCPEHPMSKLRQQVVELWKWVEDMWEHDGHQEGKIRFAMTLDVMKNMGLEPKE